MTKQVHIIGGGTISYIRPHFALSAPAYGGTAWALHNEVQGHPDFEGESYLYTTKMAGDYYEKIVVGKNGPPPGDAVLESVFGGPEKLETNQDLAMLIDKLVEDQAPKVLFLPVAVCDFEATSISGTGPGWGVEWEVGQQLSRLSTRIPPDHSLSLKLGVAEKIIERIRKVRKDIFVVGFKETFGATPEGQFTAGLHLLKRASCNLILANDTQTRLNIIVTPEEAPYGPFSDRGIALATLVDMALSRSNGHFTRSRILGDDYVPWNSTVIPESLRTVVNHCIERGAYKPFNGKTVGHFAFKRDAETFLTSMRGKDFNELNNKHAGVGLVQVTAVNDEEVVVYGGKPSVGGQSQRIIFKEHPGMDCIVHFHCPLKQPKLGFIAVRSQQAHECGSHECGQNTSNGLLGYSLSSNKGTYVVKAVMLDKHGPNIVFNQDTNPRLIIDFIEQHWDLERSTREFSE